MNSDFLYVGLTVGFFVGAAAYIRCCEQLR